MSTDSAPNPARPGQPLGEDLSALVVRDHGDRTAVAALDALHRLQNTLSALEQGQDRLEQRLEAGRRRTVGVLLAVAGAVLLGAGFWWGSRQGPSTLAGPAAARGLDPLAGAALGNEDELHRRLSTTEHERDAQIDENAELRERLATHEATIAAFDGDIADRERLEQRLGAALAARNEQFGATTRLREELIEKDRRVTELIASIDDLSARSEPPAAAGVLVSSTSERGAITPELAALVNTALTASGMLALEVLEADLDEAGVLVNLLVSRKDAWGNVEAIMQLQRLEIEADTGVVRLRLIHREVDGKPPAEELWPLDRWPRERWNETGLTLPHKRFVPVDRVLELLTPALQSVGFRIDVVGGWDGSELSRIELTELGIRGEKLARVFAARGVVERDPQRLRLLDGSRVVGESERPFWRGEMVVPLDGADLRDWWAIVR